MLDYNLKIVGDGQTGSSRALHDDIAAAYGYAYRHCIEVRLAQADWLLMQSRYRDAFGAYRDYYFRHYGLAFNAANYEDHDAFAAFKAGVYAAADGDLTHAETSFRTTIAKYPDAQEAHFFLGQVLYATGRESDARMQWLAALETYGIVFPEKETLGPDPSWMSALHEYAMLGISDMPPNRACRDPKALIESDEVSSHMYAFNVKIEDEYKAGALVATRSDIDEAFRYASTHCVPEFDTAIDTIFDKRRYRDAFVGYRDRYFRPDGTRGFWASTYDDLGASAPFEDGVFAAADGDYAAAERQLRRATRLAPGFQDANLMLGDVLFAVGRKHDARAAWLAVLGSYGTVITEKEEFGPDWAWESALHMYEMHR